MEKYRKRCLLMLLSLVLILTSASAEVLAAGSTAAYTADTDLIYDGGNGTITRAQWLHDLVTVFDMTVEEENYPDNYFSDLEEDSQYYEDILKAVQFGVVDVAAGDQVYPDAVLTRDFAAQTLNFCLGFQLDEGTSCSFTDSAQCSSPDDAQVAVNRGWLAPEGQAFLPDKAVTAAEVRAMLSDAQSIFGSDEIDENYDNTYEFADGVIVVPETAEAEQMELDEETGKGTVKITSCPVTVSQGDIFAVYYNGIPSAYKAESVSASGTVTTIQTSQVDSKNVFKDADAQGVIGSDVMQVEALDGAEVSVEEEYDADAASPAAYVLGSRGVKKIKTIKAGVEKNINGVKIKVSVVIKDPAVTYDVKASGQAYARLDGDTDVTYSVEGSVTEMIALPEIRLVNCTFPGVGGFVIKVDLEAAGAMSGTQSGYLTAGISADMTDGIRLIKNFQAETFSMNVEATAAVGLQAEFGITDFPFLKATVYAKTGAKANLKQTTYDDAEKPFKCVDFSAYLYASAGAQGSVKFGLFKSSISTSKDIYNKSNSPIKIVHHYEDGQEVAGCTRGQSSGGTAGSGYFTPGTSQYHGSGWSKGSSSGGFTRSGEPMVIYKYSTDAAGYATITSYTGNARTLYIPETLDEHKVAGIGEYAFEKNGYLRKVVIPDTVTSIGFRAFRGCTNLKSVTLSGGLLTLAQNVFQDNTAITEIEIPKSLTTVDYYMWDKDGPFAGCSGLKKVTFEEGTTKITAGLFTECTGLEEIVIPEGVTVIEASAFGGCSALKQVYLPESLTRISDYAFYRCFSIEEIKLPVYLTELGTGAFWSCTQLKAITIPDSVINIKEMAFRECTNLKTVILSKSLAELGQNVFQNDAAITEIEIPKSLAKAGYYMWDKDGPFAGCSGLKKVTFEEGTTKITAGLFAECTGLEEIVIPEGVTLIEASAFGGCSALKQVDLPESLTKISNYAFYKCSSIEGIELPAYLAEIGTGAFGYCQKLKAITIPDSVTIIRNEAFRECTNLETVILSKSLTELGQNVFQNDAAIMEIEIPKSLTKAGYYLWDKDGPFAGCGGLKKVTFEEGTTKITAGLFAECTGLEEIVIPEGVTVIEVSAFGGCSALKQVDLPESLTKISDYAFYRCGLLESAALPAAVAEIGVEAFKGCTCLAAVSMGDAVTEIGYGAFENCSSLADLTLSNGVSELKEKTFYGCSGLETLVLPSGLTTIGTSAFENSGLTEITIPDTVTSIGASAFRNSASLAQAVPGKNVKTIGSKAFQGCDALTGITIPDSVTTLGTYAFESCDSLSDIALGSGITVIPSYCFNQCAALEKVVLSYRITTVKDHAFSNCVKLKEVTIPRTVTSVDSTAFSYPANMTVYGISGTYAETFAAGQGMKFVSQEIHATAVSLSETQLTLNTGAKTNLSLQVTPADFTDEVSWKCTDTNIVTVDDTGLVTAKKVGTATIKVTVGSVSAACKVTVVQPVISISLNKTAITLEALDTFRLTATVSPSTADNKEIAWSSSDSSVAAVDENGCVTALKKGTAVITAAAKDGSNVSKSCTVTVSNTVYIAAAPEELESPHNYENNCSDYWIYTLTGAEQLNVTFDSRTDIEEDFDYLYIYDGEGNQIGTYTGTALAGTTVTVPGTTVKIKLVSDDSGNTWGFRVRNITSEEPAKQEQASLTINSVTGKVYNDAAFKLTCSGGSGDGAVTWSVPANNGVLSVNVKTGTATILGAGKVKVTAVKDGGTLYEDASASLYITIGKAKTAVSGRTCTYISAVGSAKESLNVAALLPSDRGKTTYSVSVSDSKAILENAKVSAAGTLTWGVKPGTAGTAAYIYVKAASANYETVTVKVTVKLISCSHSDKTKQVVRSKKAATCTAAGYTGDTWCTVCGKKIAAGKTIAAKGHKWGSWTTTKKPAYTAEGQKTRTCSVCGKKETASIAKLPRTSISKATVSGIKTLNYTGKPLTQSITVKVGTRTLKSGTDYTVSYKNNTNIGTATLTITGKNACKDSLSRTFKITVSRGKTYTVSGMKYTMTNADISGKGTVTLAGTTKSKTDTKFTSLSVGSTVKIGGKTFKITAIGAGAFKGYTKLKQVTIGSYVATVGKEAFSGCSVITSVTAGSGLTTLSDYAFYNCKKLSTLTIKSTKLKAVGKYAVKNIYKKAVIRVPSGKVTAYKKLFKSSTGFISGMTVKKY